MIKVLVINHNLVLRSGITMVIKNLIENSDKSLINYTIVTGKDKRNNISYFKEMGVNVLEMPHFSPSNIIRIISFFKYLFKKHRFDIVHSHCCQLDNFIFPIAKKYGVKKCISHSHSSQLSEKKSKAIINKIMCYRLSKRADYCLACSNQAGIAVFGREFPHIKTGMIVNNGIDCNLYAFDKTKRMQLRQEYGIDDNCIVIGHIGRFSAGKNQSFLIDILKEIIGRGLNYMLFLIGDGEKKNEVIAKVQKLQLQENVYFAGGKDNVYDFLNIFDLFIMPSIHEGLGISAIEAQANGLECILSTAIPKEADLTGVVFRDLDEPVSVWADTIDSLPKERHSNYNGMVANAGYDIKGVGNMITNFYMSII